MKRITLTLFAIAAFAILLNSCKLIDKLTQFNVDYSTNFTIPPTGILGIGLPIELPASDVSTNSDQNFSNNGTAADHIKEVQLKSLKLTITSPSGQKFDFLKSGAIFISAAGLPKIQVASIDNINTSTVGSSIDLNCSAQDLKEYLKQSTFTISETVTTTKQIDNNINVRADATFFVQGSILKK